MLAPLPMTKSTRSSPLTGPAIDWRADRSITPKLVAMTVCTSLVPNLLYAEVKL